MEGVVYSFINNDELGLNSKTFFFFSSGSNLVDLDFIGSRARIQVNRLRLRFNPLQTHLSPADFEGAGYAIVSPRGAGKARFNVATPTNATVTCTAYVLPYNLQTKSI